MNEAQTEAIAVADAHTSNTALPTYSELVEALRRLSEHEAKYIASSRRHSQPAINASALLARIPA